MNDQFSAASLILDGLREIELAVAELYRLFAQAFPPDRIFWEELGRDEENHATLVTELKNTLFKNGWAFEVGKVNHLVLNTYRHGIEGQIKRLHRGELGRRNALFIARDFEKTLVEHGFYSLVRSENKDYLAIQARIQKETEAHLQKLENYILTLFPS
jgi:hypothetical protein